MPREIDDALRAQIVDELPEVAEIADPTLRRGVVEAWALALARSSWRSIRDMPPSGNPGSMVLTRGDQTDHIRGVTRLAMRMGDEMAASNPDMVVNHDIVVAGGLCCSTVSGGTDAFTRRSPCCGSKPCSRSARAASEVSMPTTLGTGRS